MRASLERASLRSTCARVAFCVFIFSFPSRLDRFTAPRSQEEENESYLKPLVEFGTSSYKLVEKCDKPSTEGLCAAVRCCCCCHRFVSNTPRTLHRPPSFVCSRLLRSLAEFRSVAAVTVIGFISLGILGFLVKLIHIPINQILAA